MKLRLIAALVICVLLTSAPFIVKEIEKTQGSAVLPEETPTVIQENASGIVYVGTLESHQGGDTLIVSPAKAYVRNVGEVVYVNVTVHFMHAQPCPHPGWKIVVENLNNVKVVFEGNTDLVNPYTAEKTYKVQVLGNGSMDVVYYYGPGCPYGTEERVTVHFYVGIPEEGNLSEENNTSASSLQQNSSQYFWINGSLSGVDFLTKSIKIGNYTIEVRGKWSGENNVTYTWRDLLTELSTLKGSKIEVLVSNESGSLVAEKIIVQGKEYLKG